MWFCVCNIIAIFSWYITWLSTLIISYFVLFLKVETEQATPTEEEQLLAALRMKADAFANKDWEAYWVREGPALLTNGWLATHPDIPLAKVEEVCSLDFLSSAINCLSLETPQGHEDYTVKSTVVVSGEDKEDTTVSEGVGSQVDSEREVSSVPDHDKEAIVSDEPEKSAATATAGDGGQEVTVVSKEGNGGLMAAALSSEEMVAIWNEHYNAYYWYTYQSFVEGQSQLLVGDEEGEAEGQGEEREATGPSGEEVSQV